MNCHRLKINKCHCTSDNYWETCKSVEGLIERIGIEKQTKAVGDIGHLSMIAYNAGLQKAIQVIKEYCEVG